MKRIRETATVETSNYRFLLGNLKKTTGAERKRRLSREKRDGGRGWKMEDGKREPVGQALHFPKALDCDRLKFPVARPRILLKGAVAPNCGYRQNGV